MAKTAATEDNTTRRAKEVLTGDTIDGKAAEKIADLLAELDELATKGAELHAERRRYLDDYQSAISEISERQATIDKELQALFPAAPAPSQGVGFG